MTVDAIFGGFISKIINDFVDISKDKIKNAVKNRNNKHQSLESQIYNVIVNVLNEITSNQYEKEQDKIYDIAERLFRDLKNSKKNNIEIVKPSLGIIFSDVDNDKCDVFIAILCSEISKEENLELYREILLIMLEQKTNYSYEELQQINAKLEYLTKVLDEKNIGNDGIIITEDFNKKFQNNKKQEYIDNWNNRLFLHQDNEERPLTLADVFIMPKYNSNGSDIRTSPLENTSLEQEIESFINYKKTSNMLIKGVPGMGKTSITSWIANKYKDDDRIIILRFRDWEKEELEKGLLKAIYHTLECKKVDLNDKILILDGFDEIKSLNSRKQVLHKLFNEILDIKNIKIIITSRLGYLHSVRFQNEFKLLPFDINYIKLFYQKITGAELDERKIDRQNLDVLGIPVILYMAIMSKIDITEKTTKPELYNRIFAKEGGIFDRFSYKGIAYDEGSHLLRDKENIRKYLKFLREIAFIMFEKDDLSLTKKECKIPELEFQGDKISILEFPIKHLFESIELNIEFIHKSIVEYFIAEYIFREIHGKINKNMLKEELAGVLGNLFKRNNLSEEILEFLKYRIRNSELNEKFNIVKDTFQLMLKDGMTYYTGKCYRNVIKCEMNVFVNMLEIIHLWKIKNVLSLSSSKVCDFLRCDTIGLKLNLKQIDLERADLTKVNLIGANLTEANLTEIELIKVNLQHTNLTEANLIQASLIGADLTEANLTGADLMKANLIGVDLTGANLGETYLEKANLERANLKGGNLTGANLEGANLKGVNLERVNLTGARFDEEQVNYLEYKYDLQGVKVYIDSTSEVINYEEYCSKRK